MANGMGKLMRDVRKEAFLRAYAATGVVGTACDRTGVPRSTVSHWRSEDDAFDEACDAAYRDAVDAAETELRNRAVHGVEEPVMYKGEPVWKRDPSTGEVLLDDDFNPVPLTVTRRSDRLLEVYMKANSDRYGERSSVELSGPGGAPLPTQVVVNFVDPPSWEDVEWDDAGRPLLDAGREGLLEDAGAPDEG